MLVDDKTLGQHAALGFEEGEKRRQQSSPANDSLTYWISLPPQSGQSLRDYIDRDLIGETSQHVMQHMIVELKQDNPVNPVHLEPGFDAGWTMESFNFFNRSANVKIQSFAGILRRLFVPAGGAS
ncbi:hypothetical protein E4U43_001265 [Claviceps pusilla]|uniref:Uncharacterized protein n=1 Tax=Claviceps pusilla TaxID=123648 RepID=A0A9P7NAG3_9HYPO|nr:hypothetical protein E4U43_001265 [Claviceps pusilla]